jgi:hypothetical protein
MKYEYLFLTYLAFTVFVETVTLIIILRYLYKFSSEKLPTGMIIFAGLISVATLPYVWFVFPVLFDKNYTMYVLFSEIVVFFVEAAFYHIVLKINWKQSLVSSFACNFVSYLMGVYILNNIFIYNNF